MHPIVLLGAGGFAREVAFLIEEINRALPRPHWQIEGFIDADGRNKGATCGPYRILGDEGWLVSRQQEVAAAIGVGTPRIIRAIHERLGALKHLQFPNLIHPTVVADFARVRLGVGNIVCAGNIFTTDITVGDCNVFNLAGTFGHDLTVGSYCVFNPGANLSGGVTVGDGCLLGTNAAVLQYLTIENEATVGAGAVVTRSVPAGTTVVGVPARPIRTSTAAALGVPS